MAEDDWQAAWTPVIAAIGVDLDEAEPPPGADLVEPSAIRRYLEPLEFDCPLHYDPQVARAHGHDDVIAPYTSVYTFANAAIWRPGTVLYTKARRNAQPAYSTWRPGFPDFFPQIHAGFATELDIDFLRPARVGERLRRRGRVLLACQPKVTRVGRGAFLTLGSEILGADDDVLARMRSGIYVYTPHARVEG